MKIVYAPVYMCVLFWMFKMRDKTKLFQSSSIVAAAAAYRIPKLMKRT